MIYSMTGYGKTVLQLPTKKITLEVKSLNSKNLDMNVRMPSAYREKELNIRKTIAKSLKRGKIDVSFYVEMTGEDTNTQVNAPVVKEYIKQLKQITPASDFELMQLAVRFPDALSTERNEVDKDEWNAISEGIDTVLNHINQYRKDEGQALETDFKKRVENISNLLKEVKEIDPERIEAVRERLQKGLEELKENVDQNRFEQELVYYIEKYDITEEKVRLDNHLEYFVSTLDTKESNGKKLGFISQEIGREINTIGSKSNYAPMQKLVVQMKDELEKIKEQLLNVL